MPHPAIPAVIVERPGSDNGYFWVVQTPDHNQPGWLNLKGIGAPKFDRDAVGDKGFVQYTSNGSFGCYGWKPIPD